MELTDIKRTTADKKAEKERWDKVENEGDYPYGLTLRLDNETIKKLKLGNFDAEQSVAVVAEGFISEDSASKANGKTHRSMTIQITKMAVTQEEAGPDASETLYGGDDAD